MEAVPKLPMISFQLKVSPENAEFGPKLKQYIREHYHEDPETYNGEIRELEGQRATAIRVPRDFTGCSTLKRYYCQLHFLQSRFPMTDDKSAVVPFTWCDIYSGVVYTVADIKYEMACVLYNIGALHTELGEADSRQTGDGMKISCTHFQCAAWAFQHLQDSYPQPRGSDMSYEVLTFMSRVALAQAQECILEKSMVDNRKATIIAKVATQIVDYYKMAQRTLEQGTKGGVLGYLIDIIGAKNFKSWKRYIEFKMLYHTSVSLLYQGQQAEEQQKMGERVAYYQAALERLNEASKMVKGMDKSESVNETVAFTMDVVGGKLNASKKENEFVYHEKVPDKESLPEIKGASLVKGIPFDVNDTEVSGQDIFSRLVPMEAHEASSMYSEEKAKLLRRISSAVQEKDQELMTFMASLQLDQLKLHSEAEHLPEELIECCAALSVKPNAIKDLVDVMNNLSGLYHDVESVLQEIMHIMQEEEAKEKEYQKIFTKRPPSIIIAELTREASKYQEAHAKASESNATLHKAMNMHISNLRMLGTPLDELKKNIPSLSILDSPNDEAAIKELQHILDKVEEMRKQRMMLETNLRESIQSDDITKQLVVKQGEDLEKIFGDELKKHERKVMLMEQNMAAQDNILRALTEANARYAETRKATAEILRKRDRTITALISSYGAYEDLLAKSNKGLEFYKKLETNVNKLLQRVRSVCKVQDEEREQVMGNQGRDVTSKAFPGDRANISSSEATVVGPKLKDYLVNDTGGRRPKLKDYIGEVGNTGPKLRDYLQYMKGGEGSSRQHLAGFTALDQTRVGGYGAESYPGSNFTSTSSVSCYGSSVYSESNASSGGAIDSSSSYSNNIPAVRPTPVGSEQTDLTSSTCTVPSAAVLTVSEKNVISLSEYRHPGTISQSGTYPHYSYTPTSGYTAAYSNETGKPLHYSNAVQIAASAGSGMSSVAGAAGSMYPVSGVYHYPQGSYGGLLPSAQVASAPVPQSGGYSASSASQLSGYGQTSSPHPAPVQGSQHVAAYSATGQITSCPTASQVSSNSGYSAGQYSTTYPASQAGSTAVQPGIYKGQSQNSQTYYCTESQVSGSTATAYVPVNSLSSSQFANQCQNPDTTTYPVSQYSVSDYKQQLYPYEQGSAIHSSQYQVQPRTDVGSSTSNVYSGSNAVSRAVVGVNHPDQNFYSHSQASFPANIHADTQPTHSAVQPSYTATMSDNCYPVHSPAVTSSATYYQPAHPSSDTTAGNIQTPAHAGAYQVYSQTALNYTQTPTTPNISYPQAHTGYIANKYTRNTVVATCVSNAYPTSHEGTGYYQPQFSISISGTVDSRSHTFYSQANNNVNTSQTSSVSILPKSDSSVELHKPWVSMSGSVQSHLYSQTNFSDSQPQATLQPTAISTANSEEKSTTTGAELKSEKRNEEVKSSNLDLLSGLDFSVTPDSQTLLPPHPVQQPADTPISAPSTPLAAMTHKPPSGQNSVPPAPPTDTLHVMPNQDIQQERRLSSDLLSETSDESGRGTPVLQPKVFTGEEIERQKAEEATKCLKSGPKDPYNDPDVLKKFVQEVDKFEKFVDGITKKSLNGPTPLDVKWKELQDLQERDSHKRSISVARCYPMKNRFPDILPYDHSRVELPSTKDDYINASHVKEITLHSPVYIATQAPIPSTYADFWSMAWEQQTEIIVCLVNDAELKNAIYWPSEKGQEMISGPFSLTLQSTNQKQSWVERIITLTHKDTKMSRVVIHLQFTAWPGSTFPTTPALFLSFISEACNYHRQQRSLARPVVVHCLAGVGRTGLLCLITAAMVEITRGQGIIDVVQTAAKMSQQRKGILKDREHLKFGYEAILYYAQDLLMKRGILSSKSSFEDKRPSAQKSHKRHPSEDFILGSSDVSKIQSGLAKMGLGVPNPQDDSHIQEDDGSTTAAGGSLGNVVTLQETLHAAVSDTHLPTDTDSRDPENKKTDGSELSHSSSNVSVSSTGSHPGTVATVQKTVIASNSVHNSPQHISNSKLSSSLPNLDPLKISLPPSLAKLDPTNFSLDPLPTVSKEKITKEDFIGTKRTIQDYKGDPDDPLSQLDPLWSLNK